MDSAIFIGSYEDVLEAARTFVQRCQFANVQLNEELDDLSALVVRKLDWGGVELDFENKTTRLLAKSVLKLEASWQQRERWTWRRFFGHIGLLFWAVGIIDVPMAEFFDTLRFVSATSRMLQESPEFWDAPADVWPSVRPTLERWTDVVRANAPHMQREISNEYDWVVATDASAWGYGYTAWCPATDEVRVHGEPWSHGFLRVHGDKVGHSTFTEPNGIVSAMLRLLPGDFRGRVLVLTDNTPACYSFARGWNARSFDINSCIRRLRAAFAGAVFVFRHVEGARNPADSLSRGQVVNDASRAEVSESLRRLMGEEIDSVEPLDHDVPAA